jgi:orotate phosphoribosyltransferase
MNLFQGEYIFLHSGEPTDFKIDCDALSDEDIKQLAKIIARKVKFSKIYGIPNGGSRLALALEPYKTEDSNTFLIVDDVLTTGGSFRATESWVRRDFKWTGEIKGFCIFARKPENKPAWVDSVFDMNLSV